MAKRPRTHYSVQEIRYLNDTADIAHDDYLGQSRRRLAIRIGRRTLEGMPLKAWTLKFVDTNWYEQSGGDWSGIRNLYRFEWTPQRTTVADRTSIYVPSVQTQDDMYQELKNFFMPNTSFHN